MKLQTNISIKKQTENQIDYHSKILLLGSCFSENIGNQLAYFKFNCKVNPFGILFHPKAIKSFITTTIAQKKITKEELIFNNERWHYLNAHSSLSGTNKEVIISNLNTKLEHTYADLKTTSHLIITLGTAWVYRHLQTNEVVANCHKIPQKNFNKELLSIETIYNSLQHVINAIKTINKEVHVIFTVSPIRHVKDGFIENTRSKAHLISAIHKLTETNEKKVSYFPSYEIVMDELRDYRFYKEDMLHPNKTAINYIWEKFVATWFTASSEKIMQTIDGIQKGISHKPFNANSEQHQQFLKSLKKKITQVQQEIPTIKF